jgi:hypothetical protein
MTLPSSQGITGRALGAAAAHPWQQGVAAIGQTYRRRLPRSRCRLWRPTRQGRRDSLSVCGDPRMARRHAAARQVQADRSADSRRLRSVDDSHRRLALRGTGSERAARTPCRNSASELRRWQSLVGDPVAAAQTAADVRGYSRAASRAASARGPLADACKLISRRSSSRLVVIASFCRFSSSTSRWAAARCRSSSVLVSAIS